MPDTLPLLARLLSDEARAKGLSGNRLATAADVAQASVSRVLAGETWPTVPTLLAILGALGRDLGWLHRSGVRPTETLTGE